jgi:hypothetical protein
MAAKCSICSNPSKEAIDRDLMGGEPMRVIAGRYRLAQSSLQRHRANHLMPKAATALARYEEVTLDRLLGYVVGLQDRVAAGILRCTAEGDHPGVQRYIKEGRANVALLAKLKGFIDQGPHVVVDQRQQSLTMLDGLDVEDLRALAAAHRAGELPPPTRLTPTLPGAGVSEAVVVTDTTP